MRHSRRFQAAARLWLIACTYPVGVLVLPYLVDNR
jgi:hypothetical protein